MKSRLVLQVVKSGAGLAFVSYPEVLAKFDFCPQVFAVLFFLMLITLGLGSAVGELSRVYRKEPNFVYDLIIFTFLKIKCQVDDTFSKFRTNLKAL